VASSGGEYFQVSFAEDQYSDDAYFLIQRQFESYDGGFFYLESHERTLCGHFKISKARLGRNSFVSNWYASRPKPFKSGFRPMAPDTND
jgi:hypothetical protein